MSLANGFWFIFWHIHSSMLRLRSNGSKKVFKLFSVARSGTPWMKTSIVRLGANYGLFGVAVMFFPAVVASNK
jgi:hypothetical protein